MLLSLAINTRQVAQHSSNFSTLKMLEVVASFGVLLMGILSGVLFAPQVYKTMGLVL